MPFIHSLHYQTVGERERPPIVFLHGFLGNCNEWDKIINLLRSEFYCITVDLPGHGKSMGLAKERYTMTNCASSIVAVINELKLEKSNLLGYSMGGRLALYIAVHYPEIVSKLVLESSSPGLKTEIERQERSKKDSMLADQLLKKGLDSFISNWYEQPLFDTLRKNPENFSRLKLDRQKNDPAGLALSLKLMGTGEQPSLWENLAEMSGRTLLIVGELDSKFQVIANDMCDLNKRFKKHVIADSGHNVHFEYPDIYVETVKNFLK